MRPQPQWEHAAVLGGWWWGCRFGGTNCMWALTDLAGRSIQHSGGMMGEAAGSLCWQ